MLEEYHVAHRAITAYHPQTNGLTERFNRTLGDMLAMYVPSSHTNWDAILPFRNLRQYRYSEHPLAFHPFSYRTACTRRTQSFRTSRVHLSVRLILSQPDMPKNVVISSRPLLKIIKRARRAFLVTPLLRPRFSPERFCGSWSPLPLHLASSKLLPKYQGPYHVIECIYNQPTT